jgi:uncharacterized cupredoxin-like copper-binding protein
MKRLALVSFLGLTLTGLGNEAIGVLGHAAAGSETVMVEMKEFRFVPSRITVDRGQVTFTVHNRGELPHVFQVTGAGVDAHIGLPPGGEMRLDVLLAMPGEYSLICPIPMHLEQGMRGSIVVQ